MNPHFQFWRRWLIVAACGVLLFGIALIALPDLMYPLFNTLFFSGSQKHLAFDEGAITYIKFVYGVLGAVMVGWSISLLSTLLTAFRRGASEGWWSIATSIGIWFVVDSSYSLWSGVWQNAALNGVFFAGFTIPLAATYRLLQKS